MSIALVTSPPADRTGIVNWTRDYARSLGEQAGHEARARAQQHQRRGDLDAWLADNFVPPTRVAFETALTLLPNDRDRHVAERYYAQGWFAVQPPRAD